jgi:type IV secretory pathway VirB2 component (pilin)
MHSLAATVTPIDGGATSDAVDQVKSFLTSTAGPAVFALAVIGIGIALGVKWLRKGAKSA